MRRLSRFLCSTCEQNAVQSSSTHSIASSSSVSSVSSLSGSRKSKLTNLEEGMIVLVAEESTGGLCVVINLLPKFLSIAVIEWLKRG